MTKRVLLVDDEPDIWFFIGYEIEQLGHRFKIAKDGEEALRLVEEFLPNLVILDITMPKKDGYQVCREIRANSSIPNVPIIMLSNNESVQHYKNGFDVGANDYLEKTKSLGKIVVKIQKWLNDSPETYSANWFKMQFNGRKHPQTYSNKLLDMMLKHLNKDDLELFYFRLDGLNYDDIKDLSHHSGMIRFLRFMDRHWRIGDVLAECYEHMPNVKWPLPEK